MFFVDYDSEEDGDEYEYGDNVSALNNPQMRRNHGKKYASVSTDDTSQNVRSRCTAHNALYGGLSNSRYPPPPPRSRSDNALASSASTPNAPGMPTLGGYSDNSHSTSSLPHSNNSHSPYSPANSSDRQQGNGSAFGVPYTDRRPSDTEEEEYYLEEQQDLTPNAYIRGGAGGRPHAPGAAHHGTGGIVFIIMVTWCSLLYTLTLYHSRAFLNTPTPIVFFL